MIRYRLLQFLLGASKWINGIVKMLFGYSFHYGPTKELSFQNCVHRKKILLKCRQFPLACPDSKSFLLLHQSHDHPSCLRDDSVSLIGFDKKRILFCVSDVNVYDSKYGPFVYSTQYEQIKEVLTVPIEYLHQLADFLGEPKSILVLLSNTGRCGSTILTQMLEACPGIAAMSEADFLSNIDYWCNQKDPSILPDQLKDIEQVLRSLIKIQCKDFQDKAISHIIMKPRSQSIIFASMMHKIAPQIKHVYMWREFEPHFRSMRSMRESISSWAFKMFVANFFRKMLLKSLLPHEFRTEKLQEFLKQVCANCDNFETHAAMCALQFLSYLKQKTSVPFHVVKYETLLADPVKVFKDLATHIDISDYQMDKVLEAMKEDSQGKSQSLNQEKLKSFKKMMTSEEKAKVLEIFHHLELPSYEKFDEII